MLIELKLDDGAPKDKDTKEALEDLQAAFSDLEGIVVEARHDSCADAMEVLSINLCWLLCDGDCVGYRPDQPSKPSMDGQDRRCGSVEG